MSVSHTSGGGADDCFEEAAWWCTLIETGEASPAEQIAFRAWIAARPEHRAAYDEAKRVFGQAERVVSRAALSGVGRRPAAARAGARRSMAGAAVAASLALCAGVGWIWTHPAPGESYVTNVGGMEQAELADGSSIVLNTASAVDVRYSRRARRVALLHGQAQFDVEHDVERPFIVSVGRSQVRAVGTRFDVYEHGSGEVTVTMIEGEVAVSEHHGRFGGASQETHVVAGEQITISADGAIGETEPIDVDRVTGWTTGQLQFAATPLHEAIAEINRYAQVRIIVSDPDLLNTPISGSFRAGDPESFAQAIEALFDADARRFGDRIVLGRSSAPRS